MPASFRQPISMPKVRGMILSMPGGASASLCAFAGQRALGMLPQPMVSIHSLAALTEQMNGSNTRVLTKAAKEQAHDPGPHGQDGQPGQPSAPDSPQATADNPAPGSVEHGSEGSELPTASSAGCSGHSRVSGGVHGAPHSASALGSAGDGALANSVGSADGPTTQGTSHSAETHAEGSGQGSERSPAENNAGAQKPSRLGSLLRRFRRTKPPQAPTVSSSSADGAAERPDAEGHTAEQSSSAASQLGSPSGALRSSRSAVPEQAPVTQLGDSPAGEGAPSGPSSSAAARSSRESPHGAGAAQAPAQAAAQLDWDQMNESMMHSLHLVISNLTTVLIAQASSRPCRVP